MRTSPSFVFLRTAAIAVLAALAIPQLEAAPFAAVPELGYGLVPNFFQFPSSVKAGESTAVAVNAQGHIFLFRRAAPMLCEFDPQGKFIRSIADGLFTHPHGLRIDREGNLWTTDDGSHVVLKLSPAGEVLMVLGRINTAAEADWLFNRPADVAFDREGSIYVADGYGNSRVVKFDREGRFVKSWGKYGSGPGEFILPHSIVIDDAGRVYVGDRENMRIQIFDTEGKYLTEWKDIGYPYGLCLGENHHLWMADGGFDRIVELDENGKILGALGRPGHGPGQFAWAHFMAMTPDRKIIVADVLNWRFQVFAPALPSGNLSTYVPERRMFWGSVPSTGWYYKQTDVPLR